MTKDIEVELKQIKELMAAMGRTGTKRMILKKDNFELTLEREEDKGGRFADSALACSEENFKQPTLWSRADQALLRASEAPIERTLSSVATKTPKEDIHSVYITSPMVGTFYIAPSPEDPPFAKEGDKVDKNTVVCIIEAMKVMNEIKANMRGAIAEVLVETGQPVEFGTKLFRIIE